MLKQSFCMWKGDHLHMNIVKRWLMQRGSTVNFHMENSKDLTYFSCMLVLKLFTLLFTIDAERINSQLSHGKFKRFNLFFLHVGIKTDYITVYNWCREDQQSLHVKRQLPLHVKRWLPLHMKRWSSVNEKAITSGDCGIEINAERINSQLSHGKFKRFNLFFLHVGIKTVYITVYNWHREDQQSLHVKRQLPLHVKRWSPLHMKRQLAIASVCEKVIASVDPGGLMINAERINSQLSHGKFKRFNLFFLHVGIKTVYITVYNWQRGSTVSACEKVIASLCMKRWLPLHVKRWLPLLIMMKEVINSQLSHEKFKRFNLFLLHVGLKLFTLQFTIDAQRGSTVNFHMENSKDLTYFSCMLVLKLFTLLFTIDTERINSLCMWKGDCLCMWKGDHLCTWKGDPLCWSWGVGGIEWSMQRGSTVNFHMENSKDLTYFSCMLVLKLFTLLFTIDTERINSLCILCMWKGDCSACEKVITSAHEKAIASAHEKAIVCKKVIASSWSWGIDDQCREDQQSTFTWKIQKI